MSILAVNIGNSRTAVGIVSGQTVRRVRYLDGAPSVEVLREGAGKVEGVMLSTVVPKQKRAWDKAAAVAFPGVHRLWMSHELDFGMPVGLDHPEQTGHDRFAAAVAAAELCGTPCIACDFGTATSFNLVLPRKGFVGGVIAPGFGMWFQSLHKGTAQLPVLPPDANLRKPFAGNTADAIRLGARWGFRGMVAEILFQLTKAANGKAVNYCATGGWAGKALKECGLDVTVVPHLTLIGLGMIYARNAK